MIRDMKKAMTRIFVLALLMMASMGAWADVKVVYGERVARSPLRWAKRKVAR